MNLLQEVQKMAVKSIKKRIPHLKTGHTVKVHQRIKEGNKERIQIFEGLVLKLNSGHGADKSFTVRKIVDGIGVEKVFPLYSPLLEKIEVVTESKVRRAKLYYMRDRSGKSARLKQKFVNSNNLGHDEVEEVAAPEVTEEIVDTVDTTAEVTETTAPEAEEAVVTEEVQVAETAPEEAKAEEKPEEPAKEEAK